MAMTIRVDEQGFVWAGNMKLPIKVDFSRDMLIFHDKDKRRVNERGTDQVEIPLVDFAVSLAHLSVKYGERQQPEGVNDAAAK